MENNTTTSYNSTTPVYLPMSTITFAIDYRDWNRLKKTVESCDYKTNLWEVFASVLCGGAISGFITWLSISNIAANEKVRTILICTAITCILVSIVYFIASKGFRKQERTKIASILKELKFIEEKRPQIPPIE